MSAFQSRVSPHAGQCAIGATPIGGGELIPSRYVREHFAVTNRTLDRWIVADSLGFPKPILINRRRYWYLAELRVWELSRARRAS